MLSISKVDKSKGYERMLGGGEELRDELPGGLGSHLGKSRNTLSRIVHKT